MKVSLEYDKAFEEVAERALEKWGSKAQIDMMCEECAELITVLLKRFRTENRSSIEEVIEELVDVEVMLGQMKIIYGINQDIWRAKKENKLCNLRRLIEG